MSEPIPLSKLHESPFNRRRVWGNLDELATSIKAVGILEDLLARPHPKKAGEYELVFGHRRYRAAKLAELLEVPAKVRDLTDEQTIEVQAIENLQREDVHPLDEAEGYEQLLKLKRTHDEIAARVGKSKSYIFQRLKLLALCEKARKAFAEDKINASVALYIARIPTPALQMQALKECSGWDGEPMGVREAQRIIAQRFMLRLADAPFDTGDMMLIAKAGSCAACPKRTGNQKELFADVQSGDVCTDPDCFASKREAHTKRLLEKAAKSGKKVLEGKAAETALRETYYGGGKYVDIAKDCYEDSKGRKYSTLLKSAGASVETSIAVDSRGEVHELARRTEVVAALKPVLKMSASSSTSSAAQRDDNKKRKQAAARKRVKTLAVVAAIVEKAEKKVEGTDFWTFLAELLIPVAECDALNEIAKRRGLVDASKERKAASPYGYGRTGPENKLKKALAEMTHVHAKGLAIELAASTAGFRFGPYAGEDLGKGLKAAAAFYKVDIAKVGAAALAAAKAAEKVKKASKKKAVRRG